MHAHMHVRTCIRAHACAHTDEPKHRYRQTDTYNHARTHTHAHPHKTTHAQALTSMHARTYTRHSHEHARTHGRTHEHALQGTHTSTRSPCMRADSLGRRFVSSMRLSVLCRSRSLRDPSVPHACSASTFARYHARADSHTHMHQRSSSSATRMVNATASRRVAEAPRSGPSPRTRC